MEPQRHSPADTVGSTFEAGSLLARRRRDLRRTITDTATRMFLDHGFDAVRVSDVADACGVTERTVYNHFPTKESLLADRWGPLIMETERALADPSTRILDAVGAVLRHELDELLASPSIGDEPALEELARFTRLVRTTPALVAHERRELERLTEAMASTLARCATTPADPPPPSTWITASAVAGLYALLYRSLHQHLHDSGTTRRGQDLRSAVLHDVEEAVDALHAGL